MKRTIIKVKFDHLKNKITVIFILSIEKNISENLFNKIREIKKELNVQTTIFTKPLSLLVQTDENIKFVDGLNILGSVSFNNNSNEYLQLVHFIKSIKPEIKITYATNRPDHNSDFFLCDSEGNITKEGIKAESLTQNIFQ
ncbi:hypothetical protein [Apibacter sp. wkB309]|uniref:hypothetical protein n=1 Tax=Apibacter sp. wkB309 TaxID=1679467 RepID=UPI000CF8A428|nr:hypothetical protein [Apibacter sp. wkB309]PQL90929.1 hypothetical protein C4S75_05530 [Apibacter sp. wkB309]